MRTNEETASRIFRVTILGTFVNILLVVMKLVVGIIASSQALVADAVHSISDLLTDLAIIFGVKFWTAPPDSRHPYGHGKIETITTLAIGFILAFAAIGIGWNAVESFNKTHVKGPDWPALWVAIVSIFAKELLFHLTVKIGRKLNSSALIANAWHHRSDAFSSIPVAGAILLATFKPEWFFVDHIAAIFVAIFILLFAWQTIRVAFDELADIGIPKALKLDIEKIAMETKGVKSVHAVRGRRMGIGIHVDLHILVDRTLNVEKGHEISMDVVRNLKLRGSNIFDVVVHLEPYYEK